MTDSEKLEQLMRSVSLENIPHLKEQLLICPIEEQESKLSWLRSCGLTEPCTLKSSVNDETADGESIRFHNAIIFFPNRTNNGVFKIGGQIVDFDSDSPQKFKSGNKEFDF